MKDSDGLERAVRALREFGEGPQQEGADTRSRMLRAMANRERARRRLVRWGLPLAATLAFSSAWAAANGYFGVGWRAIPASVVANRKVTAAPSDVAASAAVRLVVPAPPATSEAAEQPPPVVPIDKLPIAPVAPVRGGPQAGGSAQPSGADAGAGASPVAVLSEADSLYATAHRLHFVERDPAASLTAWDAYLRAAPQGPLVPEAQYNRAICLVRLQRRSEASAALRPFALGLYGGYRQREAAELVTVLGGGP